MGCDPSLGKTGRAVEHHRQLRALGTLTPPRPCQMLAVIGSWGQLGGQVAWADEPSAPQRPLRISQRWSEDLGPFPPQRVTWLIRKCFYVLASGRRGRLGIGRPAGGWRSVPI